MLCIIHCELDNPKAGAFCLALGAIRFAPGIVVGFGPLITLKVMVRPSASGLRTDSFSHGGV